MKVVINEGGVSEAPFLCDQAEPHSDSEFLVEVDSATVARWKRIESEYRHMLEEMQAVIRTASAVGGRD